MQKVFERPKGLTDAEFGYCPGCLHSVVHRMIAEVMDELRHPPEHDRRMPGRVRGVYV